MKLRDEVATDHEGIRRVLTSAFPTPAEADLVEALRAAGKLTVALVAELDGRIVGHIAFSAVTMDGAPGNDDAEGLAPVAVHPDAQGKGVGSALIREGIERVKQSGKGFVVLLGEPEYYSRFGFGSASAHGLADTYGGGDAFQVLELRQGAIPQGAGTVRYAPEFDVVD